MCSPQVYLANQGAEQTSESFEHFKSLEVIWFSTAKGDIDCINRYIHTYIYIYIYIYREREIYRYRTCLEYSIPVFT